METKEIRRGTRFYPPGLNDLGDEAPEILYVRGDHEALALQAVAVAGSADATPRGRATARRLAEEISRTDIAIISDRSALGRMALGAAAEHGAAIAYYAQPLDQVAESEHGLGGTFVSLRPDNSGDTAEYAELAKVLAAHSDVALIPEANAREDSLWVAEFAAELDRKVAVVKPPGSGIEAFAGSYALSGQEKTVLIGESSGRDVINLVGVAPRTANDDLMRTLDHLEFSRRVADLRKSERIDSAIQGQLFDMAHESVDMTEFQARMNYGGARLLGATEHKYLMTTLETPEGEKPKDWDECEAWARAFGVNQYESVCRSTQMERTHHQDASFVAQR